MVIDMVLLTITAPLMRDLSRVFLDISSLKMLGISSDLKNAVGNQKSKDENFKRKWSTIDREKGPRERLTDAKKGSR